MKGLCCFAQRQGDLGKPLLITVHKKDGTTSQRCGVCEVVPSCRDPQKRVFAFRFLKAMVCGLPGKTACTPSAAGVAQYTAQRPIAATGGERTEFVLGPTGTFTPQNIVGGGAPYSLPLS